jgi:hypothetical protein
MSKSNKFNLKQAEHKTRKAMEAAIVDVGNTAKTFFRQAFVKQGFDDKSVVRWQKRKVFDEYPAKDSIPKDQNIPWKPKKFH